MQKLTITFPCLPPAELMPNRLSKQGSWHARAEARSAARGEGKIYAHQVLYTHPDWRVPEVAEVSFIFMVPTKHIRDIDALIGACKSWIDGIVDAGVICADDCWHLYLGSARPLLGSAFRTDLIFRRVK